jgi:hypothetical protein
MDALQAVVPATLKIDLGCGTRKREGFLGVDARSFAGVDLICDLTAAPWPWPDGSVLEASASHFVEHLTREQRILFVNELYRVLVPGGKATIVVPHWCSTRAYGDLTHEWPPVCEWWFNYLNANWRKTEAPHNDFYTCHFDVGWGYDPHPALRVRSQEYQSFAVNFYKEAAQDMVATLTKQPMPAVI